MKRVYNGLQYWMIFCLAYFFLAMIGLENRDPWSLSSIFWLPSGLVLGVLYISSRIYWSFWGITAFVLHIIVSLLNDRSLDVAITFSIIDLLTLFPLAMLCTQIHRYLDKSSIYKEMMIIISSVIVISILGGITCMYILELLGYPVIYSHMYTWSLANAVGCLSIAPVFIFRHIYRKKHREITKYQYFLIFISSMIFVFPITLYTSLLIWQSLLYISMGCVMILAVTLSLRIFSVYMLYMSLLITLASMLGYGPMLVDETQSAQSVQTYILALVSFGLLLSSHRNANWLSYELKQEKLRLLNDVIHHLQPIFFMVHPNSEKVIWSGPLSILSIDYLKLYTIPLLQARVHPEDREKFTECLFKQYGDVELTIRLLFSHPQYYNIRCKMADSTSNRVPMSHLTTDIIILWMGKK